MGEEEMTLEEAIERFTHNAEIAELDECEDFEETFDHHWEMMDDIEREEYIKAESEGKE